MLQILKTSVFQLPVTQIVRCLRLLHMDPDPYNHKEEVCFYINLMEYAIRS